MKLNKTRLVQSFIVLMSCTILFCGCVKNDDVVIKVNDEEITKSKYWDDFNKIKNAEFKNMPANVQKETSYAYLALKEKYTNDVILRALVNQEFEKRKIEITEDEINAKKKEFIEQMGSEEQFNKVVKENGITPEQLRADLIQEAKLDKLVKALNIKDATDADAQKFYNQNKEQFNLPERVMASHILIDTNAESIKRQIADADKNASLSIEELEKKVREEQAKKEALAKEVLAKAKANPKDFAKLAKEYSDDKASGQKGGDLGFITRDSVVKEFGDAAFTQKVGVVGPLVKSQFGEHIILVKDKSAKGMQPFAQVKNDIKVYLTQQKKYDEMQKFITGLKNNAKIEFLDESLNPTNIEKQLTEALKKQITDQQNTLKTNQKTLEKTEKAEKK